MAPTAKFLLSFFILFSVTQTRVTAQNPAPNDGQIWVIVSYVKEDSKAEYEKWMTEIFFAPMKTTQDPVLKKQYQAMRWLTPVQQSEDKTWTYVFLLDPAIPDADYDIEHYLVKTYGEAKGKTYLQQYEGFMALAGQIHFLKQGPH